MNNRAENVRVKIGDALVLLIPPLTVQVLFNFFAAHAWYAYWPLVGVTSIVPFVWLAFRKLTSAYAAGLVQAVTLLWFNWRMYSAAEEDFSGASAFVGGLGVVYVLVFSIFGGMMAGSIPFFLRKKE
jgi:hypothetical protein